MGLNDRLKQSSLAGAPPGGHNEDYQRLKQSLHTRLIEQIDLAALGKLEAVELRTELMRWISTLLGGEDLPLSRREREGLVEELCDEIVGLGPLEALLRDTTISDILVNTHRAVYVERSGRIEKTATRFRDDEHLIQTINRIVNRIGRRVDETSPMVDARLPDGSRVNAIIPPLAVDGPILSIRRFGGRPLAMPDLVNLGSLLPAMAVFLECCVRARLNVLISGGTGSGKTTMLNALSAAILDHERIITIEDAAELQLQQPHVVRLETRPPNVEGQGGVVTRDLVRNSLRMRPDRIIVGEVRGGEILDMLSAMNTGHEGSMATLHANTPRDALTRISAMVGMSGVTVSEQNLVQMVSRSIDLVVQLVRGSDGKRRVSSISELVGTEGTMVQLQELFQFRQTGVDEGGRVQGRFLATGVRPRCLERLARAGVEPPPGVLTTEGMG